MLSAFIILALSAASIFWEWRGFHEHKRAKIARQLVAGYSEQQLIKGIAIQAVTIFGYMDTMVPYHFFLIWMITTVSTATHCIALLALQTELKMDWGIRWLKQFFMFVNLMFSCVMSIFLFMEIQKQVTPTLPMACIFRDYPVITPRSISDIRISQAGTVSVIVGQCAIFIMSLLWLHSAKNGWYNPLRALSYLFLTAISIGGTVRIIQLSQVFGTPSVPLKDKTASVLNFGGVVMLCLLISPGLNAFRMYRKREFFAFMFCIKLLTIFSTGAPRRVSGKSFLSCQVNRRG